MNRQRCTNESPMPKDASGRWEHEGAECVGTCYKGCCDDFRCRDCGMEWRSEVAQ